MGLASLFRKSPTADTTSVSVVDPGVRISREMAKDEKLFALYTKEGDFIVDQFGKMAPGMELDVDESFYLAINLNFVQRFMNKGTLGFYNSEGTELQRPELADFSILHYLAEDDLVHVDGFSKGTHISLDEFENGILLRRLRAPRSWDIQEAGQLRIMLQVSMVFNPKEIDDFLLKVQI